ncbi:predicted protein [Plenodomus lingam JN3]|uniref:Predicted protein n=1 Tax=Leptosphaeria maculans (strain JN3 / isolate v23.1.3 / race Av1-4-5-6-7-8) TaxID=985895 RepID=E5A423_LEPMJ|nr:predicted protein [Plenodomus lingam JN3]CBX98368.1 predicted protein [Plenodomus lingam JN3]
MCFNLWDKQLFCECFNLTSKRPTPLGPVQIHLGTVVAELAPWQGNSHGARSKVGGHPACLPGMPSPFFSFFSLQMAWKYGRQHHALYPS